MTRIKVYLHNDYSTSELMEEYNLTEAEALKIRNLTEEVALTVDLDNDTVVVDK